MVRFLQQAAIFSWGPLKYPICHLLSTKQQKKKKKELNIKQLKVRKVFWGVNRDQTKAKRRKYIILPLISWTETCLVTLSPHFVCQFVFKIFSPVENEWYLILIFIDQSFSSTEQAITAICVCFHSVCSMHWSQGAYSVYAMDQILWARAKLIPVCNPSGEIEVQAAADRSQRQWFKGQNQQHSSLGKDDADRHTLMGNSWSVCGVIQTKAFIS